MFDREGSEKWMPGAAGRVRLLVAGSVLAGAVLVASLGVAGGAGSVAERASSFRTAEVAYHRAIKVGAPPVLRELARTQASSARIEPLYFAWVDAPEDRRRAAADVLLDELNGHLDSSRGTAGASVSPLLAPLNEARSAARTAYGGWVEVAESPSGRAAIAAGLAAGPP